MPVLLLISNWLLFSQRRDKHFKTKWLWFTNIINRRQNKQSNKFLMEGGHIVDKVLLKQCWRCSKQPYCNRDANPKLRKTGYLSTKWVKQIQSFNVVRVKNAWLICQCKSYALRPSIQNFKEGLIFTFYNFISLTTQFHNCKDQSFQVVDWLPSLILYIEGRKKTKQTNISLARHFSKIPLLSVYIGRTQIYVLGLEMVPWWA